jgi:signal transduction histidine kinase
MLPIFGDMKIKTQLFLLFLALSVLLTGSFALTIYYFTRELVLRQVNAQLDSVAETKASQVKGMIANIHELSSFLSRNREIGQRIAALQRDRPPQLQGELSAHLSEYVIDILQFKQITLLDTAGIVIASSNASLNGRNLAGTPAYRKGKADKNQVIGFFYDHDDNYRLQASDLLFNEQNQWTGIVVIDLDADPFLELVNDYTGLGRTGETNLATAVGEYGLYLTPLKFDRNAALKRKIALHQPQLAMSLALDGQTGLQEAVLDYTGQAVIASTRYLPDTGWGIVTKMDRQEALSGVHALERLLLLISLAGVAAAVVASYLLGRYLARPVERLIEHTNRVKAGDLTARLQVANPRELGLLADAFNGMTEQLERKMDDLDKFAYVVSHDLKSPLNVVIPLIDLIRRDKASVLSEKSLHLLEMAHGKTLQMKEFIDQVLLATKEDSLSKEVLDVNRIVEGVLENVNSPAHITVFVQKNLPPVRYHKVSLFQVFQNLIGNAVKYMDKPAGEIKVGCTKQSTHYLFSVQDNGRGIAGGDLGRVFGLFEKAHPGTAESTGIGLSIVKRIVEENNGRIWVESEVGVGSTFYFTVPLT